VQFEHQLIELKNKPSEFLDLSPTGKVPLLQLDDGSCVSESINVARHIAKVFKDHADLLPAYGIPLVDAFLDLWTQRVEPAYYKVLGAESEGQVQFALVGLMEAMQAVENILWSSAMQAS